MNRTWRFRRSAQCSGRSIRRKHWWSTVFACRLRWTTGRSSLKWEDLCPQVVFVSATPAGYEGEMSGNTVEQVVRPTGLVDPVVEVRPAGSQVDDLLGEIRETVGKGERGGSPRSPSAWRKT